MKRTYALIVAFVIAFSAVAQEEEVVLSFDEQQEIVSQEPENQTQGVLKLSLQEARDMAIKQNRTLANASLDVRMAYAKRWQTIAQMLPQVNASFDYQNMCGYKMDFGPMSMSMPPSATIGITASIALNGQMIVGALLNNLSIEMQDINRKNTELDVVSQVDVYYITALAMQNTVDLLDKCKENLDQLYEITQNAVDVGTVEQTSADQIQVQVASMKSSINSTKRSLELIYNSLALQIAADPDVKIELTDNIDELLNVDEVVKLLNSEFVIENNYSYQLAQKNVELQEKSKLLAWMAYVPTISAFYQYSYKTYFSNEETFNMTPPNMVGVSISIPIWSSGNRAAAITEKKLAVEQAQNSLDQARDGLHIQLKQLRYNLSSAFEDFDTQKFNIEVSERVFDSTSNKFEYGRASAMELTQASTTLLSAQSDYIKSILNMVQAQIDLQKLLNKK